MNLFLCSTALIILCVQYSDAWFLKRANLRRYGGGRPRIIVGDAISMPAADEVMMQYVKNTAIEKMKEYNLKKQKENSGDDYYELPSAYYPEEVGGSASSDSITIGLPMPFIHTKSKPKPKPVINSDTAYSTIKDKYKELYPEPEQVEYSSSSSPNYMKMIKIDLTHGSPKNTDSVVKFFKMPGGDSVSEASENHSSKKRPMSFIIQWNLPMMFRKYR